MTLMPVSPQPLNPITSAQKASAQMHSPVVWMTTEALAPSLRKPPSLCKALVTAKTHKDLDPAAPAQPIHYVHTAPTHSGSPIEWGAEKKI